LWQTTKEKRRKQERKIEWWLLVFLSLVFEFSFFFSFRFGFFFGCLASVNLCQPAKEQEKEAQRVGVEVAVQG